MSNISNKTVFSLLFLAVIISLVGTFISLNKLGELPFITGLQANQTTQQGQTSVVILGSAQLTLYNTTMNFGSGQVNGSYTGGHDLCTLQSNATINSAGNDFTGSSLGPGSRTAPCVGGWLIPWSFVVENTGNSIFSNVTMNTTGGNLDFQQSFSSAVQNGTWTYRIDEEGDSCTGTASPSNYNLVPGASLDTVCDTFLSSGGADAFVVQMNVSLPEDAAAATWSNTVTFTGNV